MITSKFIYDMMDLLLDGEDEERQARCQLDYLNDSDYDYTGVGLYVYFTHSDGIEKYKTQKPDLILNGVKIKSENLAIEADAILFFKNGIIDYLEIWSVDGNYPFFELAQYELTQVWSNSPGRKITIK